MGDRHKGSSRGTPPSVPRGGPAPARGVYRAADCIGGGAIVLRAWDSRGTAIAEVRVRAERELYDRAAAFLGTLLDEQEPIDVADARRREVMRLVR